MDIKKPYETSTHQNKTGIAILTLAKIIFIMDERY